MKLVEPTDFEILEMLAKHGRNNAQNIAILLEKNRQYINTRLPQLTDYGLAKRIGPAENSGLYEITEKGRIVLEYRDRYASDKDDFEEFIDRKTEEG